MSKFSTVIFSTGCPHKPSVPEGNVCKFHENPICRGRILGRNSDKSQVLRVFVFDRKPCPLPYGLIKKSIQKPENSQDYAQKHQQNC